jgi:hypothetical protein
VEKNGLENQRKKLRALAETAYEREMNTASEELLQQFHRWKNSEIDVFELNDKIHQFHNGISRTLYNRYTGVPPELGVAIALNKKILSREEVGEDVFLSLEGIASALSFPDPQ